MVTLSELKKDGYKYFNRQSPENKAKNIQILNYLDMLSSQSGINMNSWDIEELFRDPKEKRSFILLQDRGEVNKIVFAHHEKVKNSLSDEVIQIERLIRGPMKDFQTGQMRDEINRTRERRDRKRAEAERYATAMANMVKEAYEHEVRLDSLSGANNHANAFSDQVVQLLKDGFWKFEEFDGTTLKLSTASDVVIQEYIPAAGVHNRVNMGRFRAELNCRTMGLICLPCGNNIKLDGSDFTHPFIHPRGDICFGDASTRVANMRSAGEVKNVFDTLAALLTNYGSGNPYVSLNSFITKRGNLAMPAPTPNLAQAVTQANAQTTEERIEF